MTMAEAGQDVEDVGARLSEVRRRVAVCAEKAGRSAEEIRLIAVTKTHPPETLSAAYAAGARDFGENRVQEAEVKIESLHAATEGLRWHLIGHLQSNKARRAVKLFDLIHSVDSAALVRRLEKLCAEEDRARLDVLVQVDLAGEATKSGANEKELHETVEAFKGCERLRFCGLMILPPFFDEAERARPFFRRLRELRDELQERAVFGERGGELSMGMSHDFEVAIEEGATMVRVGTAIFGTRHAY